MIDGVWAVLAPWQFGALALCFLWSGFVRSGLGFGGAALTLPMLLMIIDDPLVFLPTICWQLLFFSALTVATRLHNVDWAYLVRLCLWLSLPFAAGLIGLLSLSGTLLSLIVYSVTLVYGISYVLDRVLTSKSRLGDALCLLLGGYVSGVSLIGAPLIVALSTRHLPASRLRDTLFVVWIVLVLFKVSTFLAAGVDMHWELTWLTFPLVAVGHWLGLRAHAHIVAGGGARFNRIIGLGLTAISLLGIVSLGSRLT